jgi:hypothetical protein
MLNKVLIITALVSMTSFQVQAESSIVNISPDGGVHVRGGGTVVDVGGDAVKVDSADTATYPKKPAHPHPVRRNTRNEPPASMAYVNTELSDKNFNGRNLARTTFTNTTLERVSFRDADLRGAKFVNVEFHDCDLRGARVDGATFTNVEFNHSRIRDVDFSRASMVNVEKVSTY